MEYILREGLTQQEKGAHILDVNVGLPEIDEPAMMEEAVKELQSVVDLPLQLDTSDIQAMERDSGPTMENLSSIPSTEKKRSWTLYSPWRPGTAGW